MREKPDCQTCGACCWTPKEQEVWCDITAGEAAAFSPQFRARNVTAYSVFATIAHGKPPSALRTRWLTQAAGPFKGRDACVCCQLDGSLMHRTRCRIYANRPTTCRKAVRPGDRNCREARRMLLRALEEPC